MDGVFVPNITMGIAVVEMARRCTKIPLNVHLMLIRPDQYIGQFIDAGADSLAIHVESNCDVAATLENISLQGVRPGVALNPETPAISINPFLQNVKEIICMTVTPGYGGQNFMSIVLPKIREVRDASISIGKLDIDILVDGGIDFNSGAESVRQGANVLVAGTVLYNAEDMSVSLRALRTSAQEASLDM